MQIITDPTDHPKEYFYKISANGSKNYYHRTSIGHKRIAKAKIPASFLDRIKPYDDKQDPDWLRQKQACLKKQKKAIADKERYLKLYMDGKLSVKNFSRSMEVYDKRIESYDQYMRTCEKSNNKWSEWRYKEETRQYGGFKNYFKAKYGQYHRQYHSQEKYQEKYQHQDSQTKYSVLKKEGIIQGSNNTYKDVRKRYRRWLVKNHPDKGGSDERCRDVIAEFKEFEEVKVKKQIIKPNQTNQTQS